MASAAQPMDIPGSRKSQRSSSSSNTYGSSADGSVNVDWLARGSSLKEKGYRCRASSISSVDGPHVGSLPPPNSTVPRSISSSTHPSAIPEEPQIDTTVDAPIERVKTADNYDIEPTPPKRSSTLPTSDADLLSDLRRVSTTASIGSKRSSSKRSWFHNLSSKFHHSASNTPSPSPSPALGLNSSSPSPAPPIPSNQTVRPSKMSQQILASKSSPTQPPSSKIASSSPASSNIPIVSSAAPIIAPVPSSSMVDNLSSSPSDRLSRTMAYSAASIQPPISRSKSAPSSWDYSNYNSRRSSSPRVGVEPISPVMSPPHSSQPYAHVIGTSTPPSSKTEVTRTSSLVSKLKRISGKSSSASPAQSNDNLCSQRIVYNYNPDRHCPKLEHLHKCLPPRVSFDISVLERDPPQQIPSRNPRVGNITFSKSGDLMREPLPAGVMPPGFTPYLLPKNYSSSTLSASTAAYDEAQRVAQAVKLNTSSGHLFKRNAGVSSGSRLESNSESEYESEAELQDAEVKPGSAQVKIDTPMHTGHIRSDKRSIEEVTSDDEDQCDVSPEAIYTRCCHLREIMPINATLKQIKGRTSPLQVIKMMNPKPTQIEMLALTDFLSIVPVCMVIFDHVHLSKDMIQLLFAALIRSKSLIRLSLRNMAMDAKGWKAFCAFLSQNKSLIRLDLSMHSAKTSSKSSSVAAASSELPDRSSMDWGLFADSLVQRGGLEELVLTGCMVPSQELSKVILQGCSPATKRLGLALNELSPADIEVLRQWVESGQCCCEGLDLGGNDLNNSYEFLKTLMHNGMALQFLSLNNAGLSNVDALASIVTEVSSNTMLKFVDLSSNPDLFPRFTPILAQTLPRFKDLRRIHLDSNNIGTEDIVRLAGAFANCPSLVHISLLNNNLDTTACAALSVATHLSNTIYTIECNQELWPTALKRRLGHYCMVNMEYMAGRISRESLASGKHDEINKEELMDAGKALAKATAELAKAKEADEETEASMDTVAQEMVRRAREVRDSIRVSLEDLFRKRSKEGLSDSEKEELIRLCFLDGTLQKTLTQYEKAKCTGSKVTLHPSVPTCSNPSSQLHKDAKMVSPMNDSHLLTLNALDRSVAMTAPQAETDPDLKVAPVDDTYIESLSRKSSTTSLQSLVRRQQEVEEGKLHKLGSFLRSYGDKHDATQESRASGESSGSGEQVQPDSASADSAESRHSLSVTELIAKLERLHGPEIQRILEQRDEGYSPCNGVEELERANGPGTATDKQALDSVVDDLAREWPT